MDIKKTIEVIDKMADVMEENKDYLSDLDREIGDADHGVNMAKGFKFVKKELETGEFKNLKELFLKVSMTLISKVGGASGPLYGTFFMKFANDLADQKEFTRELFEQAFKNGVDGVKLRGKATVGEKTMVDVLEPVSQELSKDTSYSDIINLAKEKMEKTKDIKATKGRASYLGDRSIGHIDPGACSSYLLIKTALENI